MNNVVKIAQVLKKNKNNVNMCDENGRTHKNSCQFFCEMEFKKVIPEFIGSCTDEKKEIIPKAMKNIESYKNVFDIE